MFDTLLIIITLFLLASLLVYLFNLTKDLTAYSPMGGLNAHTQEKKCVGQ